MIYLYDVWVNWFEGEEAGYNVCHYYEWRKNDDIELLEQVPVLLISTPLYNIIENSLNQLPNELLHCIHNKSFIRKNNRRKQLDYACVLSDGRGIIAIHTYGTNMPVKKSRLIPRQTQQVFELIKKMKMTKISHYVRQYEEDNSFIQSSPLLVVGLTRKEREAKNLLMKAMEQLKKANNKMELLYWYSEWDYEKMLTIDNEATTEMVWSMLYDEVKEGWSESHELFCQKLIKGNIVVNDHLKLERFMNENKL